MKPRTLPLLLPLVLGLCVVLASRMNSAESTTLPPVAPQKNHSQTWYGRTFIDPYHWLREKGSPDVLNYLEAENAYTEKTAANLKVFSAALYEEMLGRIKQADLSVPARDGRFYYYRRPVEGRQYPIRCRRPAGQDGSRHDIHRVARENGRKFPQEFRSFDH